MENKKDINIISLQGVKRRKSKKSPLSKEYKQFLQGVFI